MTDSDIKAKVLEKAKDGRIACKVALALAAELGVAPKQIGDTINRENIRIVSCQLGCFK